MIWSLFTIFLQFDCQNLEGNIGAGIDKKEKEKMLNVHSENHGRVRTTSNSFFQVRRQVLEEQEGCDTSELSLDVKEEVEDVDSNIPLNGPPTPPYKVGLSILVVVPCVPVISQLSLKWKICCVNSPISMFISSTFLGIYSFYRVFIK